MMLAAPSLALCGPEESVFKGREARVLTAWTLLDRAEDPIEIEIFLKKLNSILAHEEVSGFFEYEENFEVEGIEEFTEERMRMAINWTLEKIWLQMRDWSEPDWRRGGKTKANIMRHLALNPVADPDLLRKMFNDWVLDPEQSLTIFELAGNSNLDPQLFREISELSRYEDFHSYHRVINTGISQNRQLTSRMALKILDEAIQGMDPRDPVDRFYRTETLSRLAENPSISSEIFHELIVAIMKLKNKAKQMQLFIKIADIPDLDHQSVDNIFQWAWNHYDEETRPFFFELLKRPSFKRKAHEKYQF